MSGCFGPNRSNKQKDWPLKLRKLLEKKKALETAELVKAIERSGRSYSVIMEFLNQKDGN